jgi:hypothetical protein
LGYHEGTYRKQEVNRDSPAAPLFSFFGRLLLGAVFMTPASHPPGLAATFHALLALSVPEVLLGLMGPQRLGIVAG